MKRPTRFPARHVVRLAPQLALLCLLALATAAVASIGPARAMAATSSLPAGLGKGTAYCTSYPGGVASPYSFQDVYACEGTTTGSTTFDQPGAGVYAWQCVELSERFLWAIDGLAPVFGNTMDGATLVSLYHAANPSVAVGVPGPGSVPEPGDVISLGPGGAVDPSFGHTAVVISSNLSAGTFAVMSQNDPEGAAGKQTAQIDLAGGHNGYVNFNGAGWTKASWLELASAATATQNVGAALIPGTTEGYSLNGDGTLTPFGGAPAATQDGHQWPNWNIARAVAILPDGTGGYVLDGWGGIHPFAIGSNPMPAGASGAYWQGWDIARGIVLNPAGTGGYVLDGWGGIHPFAIGSNPVPPGASGFAYWKGWDIARGIAVNRAGTGGYVLDGWGGIHPFAIGSNPIPPSVHGAYWQGWDIARAIVLDFTGTSGYVLDGWGGLHPFYADGTPSPPAPQVSDYTSGQDLARAVVLYQATQQADQPGAVSGVVLDADSSTPHPFTTGADGRAVAFLPGSSTAGYVLSGDGTLTPIGGAPPASGGPHWSGWDIARAVTILPNGTGGYVLDGWGGIHPFAIGSDPIPPGASGFAYWKGWDIARGIVLNPAGTGGYVLDGWGGIHPFAIGSNPVPPGASTGAYYSGWDVADGIALGADGRTVAVVDSHDGIHMS